MAAYIKTITQGPGAFARSIDVAAGGRPIGACTQPNIAYEGVIDQQSSRTNQIIRAHRSKFACHLRGWE